MHGHHIGMVEGSSQPGLALETRRCIWRGGNVFTQNFYRDLPLEGYVFRFIYSAHPSLSKAALQAVAASQNTRQCDRCQVALIAMASRKARVVALPTFQAFPEHNCRRWGIELGAPQQK